MGSELPPFFLASRIEGQSLPRRKCFTRAPRGQELPLHWHQVVIDFSSLYPSSLACRHFEGTDRSFWSKPLNLRRLVAHHDDSSVSSSAYPFSTLLGGMRREILRDRLSLPLHRFAGQSLPWGGCITPASRGEELHLYNIQVIKDLFSLRPSSLVSPPFRGNGSQNCAV